MFHTPRALSIVFGALMAFGLTTGSAAAATQWQRFFNVYNYEVQTYADGQRIAGRVWNHGGAVCNDVGRGWSVTTIRRNLRNNFGYSGSGAEAVIAAALRVRCPRYDGGYRTYFDREVEQAQTLIYNGWGRRPPLAATGETAKLVCSFLARRSDATGLTALMHSEGTPGGAPIKLTVRSVVAAHCPAQDYKLGPYWYQ